MKRLAELSTSLSLLLLSAFAAAQTLEQRPSQTPLAAAPAAANSNPTYQQLRNVGLSGEVAAANNLVLKRDAGVFTFRSGNFYFLAAVNGKVTGAIFLGNGSFELVPPLEMEKRTLSLLTKEPGMTEGFNQVVLRFTDGTYDEIRKAAGVSGGSPGGGTSLFSDVQSALRKDLRWNLTARLLQDVLSPEPGDSLRPSSGAKNTAASCCSWWIPTGLPTSPPRKSPSPPTMTTSSASGRRFTIPASTPRARPAVPRRTPPST